MSTLTWADVMANPYLKNLPFKIELNRWGKIEMSPASNRRGLKQIALSRELEKQPGGQVLVECSIQTTDGVRVADVAWVSDAKYKKAALYLEAGAEQVWIVAVDDQRTVIAPPRP